MTMRTAKVGLFTTLLCAVMWTTGCVLVVEDPDDGIDLGGDDGWSRNATDLRGEHGAVYSLFCPPPGNFRTVWGTDLYTDDSSICTAAVHAGLITRNAGGRVVFEIAEGESSYQGSTRNGVTTLDYGSWPGSFFFH